tara:strand:- start:177 stop:500 length:324 start_codon:yes stop_codon:yes gene_type:complete
MNLNKTMKHFGLAGTGVIVLLLMVVVYYLHLIEENTSLEGFDVGGQHPHAGPLSPKEQRLKSHNTGMTQEHINKMVHNNKVVRGRHENIMRQRTKLALEGNTTPHYR